MQQNFVFTQIKNMIDKNKTYPNVAKRRGIEGNVIVSFIISPKGEFIKFENIVGKKVFYKSVQNAIKKIFPFPTPKEIFTSSQRLSLVLEYKLY